MKRVLSKPLPFKNPRFFWYLSVAIFSIPIYLSVLHISSNFIADTPLERFLVLLYLFNMFLGSFFFMHLFSGSKRKLLVLSEMFLALGIMFAGPIAISSIKGENITHDGTRTGPRVGYQSYCDPTGGYVIYENEKLEFKKEDGEIVYWTKDDIECYQMDMLANKTKDVTPTTIVKPIIKEKESLISCTGPDYKTFMTTQEKCDEFNSAWGKSSNYTQPATVNSQPDYTYSSCNNYSIPCTYPNSFGTTYTTTVFGCTYQEVLDKCSDYQNSGQCIADAWSVYNQCIDTCKKERDLGLYICEISYSGSEPLLEFSVEKYAECSEEVWQIYEDCKPPCPATRDASLALCN